MISSKWPRWIKASVSKHFDANRSGIALYIEGDKRLTTEPPELFEQRINGPFITEYNKKAQVKIVINLLIKYLPSIRSNLYRMEDLKGIASSMFTITIPLLKLGDDGSSFGCLTRENNLDIIDWGLVDTGVHMATVEAEYKGLLDGSD